ncbi:DNA translocase FtsK [Patescibacteria group bacterium]|nr:DNA translocase FtsK [Patescibacteria group bacterium]
MEIPVDLLDANSSEGKSGDIDRNQEIIRRTFENFNIDVEMIDVRIGPTVTQYSLRPAEGMKLSRIVALHNDLALALAAHPIRIEAPIPGRSLVGVEVPNQVMGRVSLRELLESKVFKHRKTNFAVPLGKDVGGLVQMITVDGAPHMLVAGATGSGKSVCLNNVIVSLLYQNGPDDLKLILVDPKRVELGGYAGIPHLLVPPITKVDEAINAMKWAVREMERRLDHLSKSGVRDIDAYNQKHKERMPKIVIIIDELADLMTQNKRDVEAVVVRIAQMARAAGIHIIVATQRPSVDVITGLIKANIPTRIAFAVASQVDSKTILDVGGAEKLLGRGDMLLTTPQISKPKRLQGAFVSDKEIKRVVDFLKSESEPDYNYQVTEDTRTGGTVFDAEDADSLLEDAIQIVVESGKASTSFLQRRMKIGYSRAARIIDMMEEMGVVGMQDGARAREVLIDHWPLDEGQEDDNLEEEGYDEEEEEEH